MVLPYLLAVIEATATTLRREPMLLVSDSISFEDVLGRKYTLQYNYFKHRQVSSNIIRPIGSSPMRACSNETYRRLMRSSGVSSITYRGGDMSLLGTTTSLIPSHQNGDASFQNPSGKKRCFRARRFTCPSGSKAWTAQLGRAQDRAVIGGPTTLNSGRR